MSEIQQLQTWIFCQWGHNEITWSKLPVYRCIWRLDEYCGRCRTSELFKSTK